MTQADSGRAQLSTVRGGLLGYVRQQILDLIRTEGLQGGDRLESVKKLAERLSVSPPTVREALRGLQVSGVLEMRHGSGIYVRDPRERALIVNPIHRNVDAETTLDLLDARLLIEPQLAELTAQRMDEQKAAELERLLEQARQCLDEEPEVVHRANMSFHRAIAEFSGNSILAEIIESLIELYSSEQLAVMSLHDDRLRDYMEHHEILTALRDGDLQRAHEVTRLHISGARETVAAWMSEHTAGKTAGLTSG